MKNINIAILQPQIPHYRTEFYTTLNKYVSKLDIFVYNSTNKTKQEGYLFDYTKTLQVCNLQFKGILCYNPFNFLNKKYDTLVLMWHFAHLTTWLLLITKFIHRKKIILWGQGISVKRYLKEEQKPNSLLKWMLALSDGAWVYMSKEANIWQNLFPGKKIVALNNTLSGINDILEYKSSCEKDELKRKYHIKEKFLLIFCARFTNPYRRTDILIETIEKLDKERYGFIIIGEGVHKPDFSHYNNVYDFGALYETKIKKELFELSDLYFQPGWVGLSIVEAMAYGKPICTFVRSRETLQCVEYSYIVDGVNGLIFNDMADCINRIGELTIDDIKRMGNNGRLLVKEKLTICNMVKKACSII